MSIDVNATYRDGALHPETPLNLPDNTPVHVWIVPKTSAEAAGAPTGGETHLTPPPSPRITVEQFDEIFRKHRFSASPLPDDFSRADIYSDHD
jgi:hypothetical protein